ncbi:MAG: thioredoxin [bacterium]
MSSPVSVTEQTFEAEVLEANVPVLVDFWAEWCAPCRMIAPVVDDLAQEYAGRLKVVKVDVDENRDLALRYNVRSIPTLGLFKDGELVKRIMGYMPKGELKRQIEAATDADASASRTMIV